MDKTITTIISDLDLAIASIPPRSKLYHLEPIGIGTPYIESLTGYISRLAEAHCITVYRFFKYLLYPLINKTHIFYERTAINTNLAGINSIDVSATQAVHAIESLTLRNDITFLTLLPWSNVLVNLGLLAPNRQWCPYCYEEWRSMGHVVYEPLLWIFRDVRFCLRHERYLNSQCTFCSRTQSWITSLSRPGYCSRCNMWLGNECTKQSSDTKGFQESDELKYQKWCVDNIGEILATATQLLTTPKKDRCAKSLAHCIGKGTANTTSSLAALLQVHPNQVTCWRSGRVQPQLPIILRICNNSGVRLVEYLTGNLDCDSHTKLGRQTGTLNYYTKEDWKRIARRLKRIIREKKLPPSESQIAKQLKINRSTLRVNLPDLCNEILVLRKSCRKKRYLAIETELTSIIIKKEFPPPSVAQVAKRVKFNRIALKKRFPEQCKEISERFFAYCKTLKADWRRQLEEEIRQVAIELHKDGIRPSFPEVRGRLAVPSRMSDENARMILRQVQRALGYR